MSCQLLCQFKVPGRPQDSGHEVMAEGVRCNPAACFFTERLPDPFADNVAPGAGRDRLDFLTRPLIMTGKEGQGGQGTSGATVQRCPGIKIIPQRLKTPRGETDNGLFVAFTDDDGPAFVPVNISTPQVACLMHT